MEILHKDTKEVLLSIDAETLVDADLSCAELQNANLRSASLQDADLWCANLQDADLRDANLADMNLEKVNLQGADLQGANLKDSYLKGANLQNANLRYTTLQNVTFKGANLSDAKIDYQIQDGLLKTIADVILKNPEQLEMRHWHTSCGTNHCLAGWACTLNETAAELEKTHGTQVAALLTLGAEAHSHFFDSNENALKFLKSVQQT